MEITKLFFTDEDSGQNPFFDKHWEEAKAIFSSNSIFFLEPDYIIESSRMLNLPQDAIETLVQYREQIVDDSLSKNLFLYLHYCLFHVSDYPLSWITQWPSSINDSEAETDSFYLLLLLSGLKKLKQFYQDKSIPVNVFQDTIADMKRRVEHYQHENRRYGIAKNSITWFTNHFRGKLFQLGRLQFVLGFLMNEITVFRNKDTDLVMALSKKNLRKKGDGIVGNPILPNGKTIEKQTFLSFVNWKQVLTKGDPILDIHIPAGGSLTRELCRDSFKAALKFFPEYFPKHNFKAFACNAWLLDNQFQELLPASANIIRFQKEFYLVPISTVPKDIMKRIFGSDFRNLNEIKPKTTLQKVALQHILKGYTFQGGGGFLLPEDVKRGPQVYIDQILDIEKAIARKSEHMKREVVGNSIPLI